MKHVSKRSKEQAHLMRETIPNPTHLLLKTKNKYISKTMPKYAKSGIRRRVGGGVQIPPP